MNVKTIRRDKKVKIRLTQREKDYIKSVSSESNLSEYFRSKILPQTEDSIEASSSNLEIERAKYKKVPKINHSFYVRLSEISEELKKLGDWGEHLEARDRISIAKVREQIAELNLEIIGNR